MVVTHPSESPPASRGRRSQPSQITARSGSPSSPTGSPHSASERNEPGLDARSSMSRRARRRVSSAAPFGVSLELGATDPCAAPIVLEAPALSWSTRGKSGCAARRTPRGRVAHCFGSQLLYKRGLQPLAAEPFRVLLGLPDVENPKDATLLIPSCRVNDQSVWRVREYRAYAHVEHPARRRRKVSS